MAISIRYYQHTCPDLNILSSLNSRLRVCIHQQHNALSSTLLLLVINFSCVDSRQAPTSTSLLLLPSAYLDLKAVLIRFPPIMATSPPRNAALPQGLDTRSPESPKEENNSSPTSNSENGGHAQDEKAPPPPADPPPDGGFNAYMQVVGAHFLFFNSW